MDNFEKAKELFLEGLALLENSEFLEAETKFVKSLEALPNRISTLLNLSVTQLELKKFDLAKSTLAKVLELEQENAEANLNLGIIETKLKHFERALQYFDKSAKVSASYFEAWSNKGNTLHELKRFEEAISSYDKAISLNPNYAEAYSNKGNTLHELKRFEEAVASYDKAISLNPNYAEAYSNKANTLTELKRYEEAITSYEQAISLKSQGNHFLGNLLHTKMVIASWDHFDKHFNSLVDCIKANENICQPFSLLSIVDDPALHLEAAKLFVNDKFPAIQTLPALPKFSHQKIRIGYFSPDFKSHPVSFLTAELFELHDRSRFEIYAFSLQPSSPRDAMRRRLIKSFDHFINIENKSDLAVAKLVRDLEIDIAVDLGGHTQNSRVGIFSYRAAPIQVNYLGYPGSLGAPYIDYIIGDKTLIPKSSESLYLEKIAYLPHSYMVDDSRRLPSDKLISRKDAGLPEDRFVFCCFNNSYKFNLETLQSWANILLKTPQSILWISENNPFFRLNLLKEFTNLGITSDRIIFAKRVDSMAEHLGRHRLADLFLDTLPFNAHTTAMDSLKAGLPVLTLIGKAFAGRVASSLLKAIELPELITTTRSKYEALAIELASDLGKLKGIREKLRANLVTTPLFNTPLFTKDLESIYIKIYERYCMDLPPAHLTTSTPNNIRLQ